MLLLPLWASSQVVDSSKYTVWYSVGYKEKTEGDPDFKDKEVLEIGNNYSFYYSYQRKLLNNYVDSMERLYPSPETRLLHYDDKTPWMGNSYMILKSQHNDSLVYMEKINQGQWFRYTENFPVDGWKLADGDTTILSLPCNKATLDLHGRHWTVWYTTEIPISDGPWKFKGIPGLIMKASESEGIFSFICIGINESHKPIVVEKHKFVNTTPKKFENELKDYWSNQMEYIMRVNNIPLSPGSWKNEKSYTPCLMEFY